jgi:hypothetical protein
MAISHSFAVTGPSTMARKGTSGSEMITGRLLARLGHRMASHPYGFVCGALAGGSCPAPCDCAVLLPSLPFGLVLDRLKRDNLLLITWQRSPRKQVLVERLGAEMLPCLYIWEASQDTARAVRDAGRVHHLDVPSGGVARPRRHKRRSACPCRAAAPP